MSYIAVIDIGKTNAKLALVDRATLSEVVVLTRPNTVLPGPLWPHFDLDGHWDFLLEALAKSHAAHGIDAISITSHGASCVLLDIDGELAAPMLDYEHSGPDALAKAYDQLRPSFDQTGSPRLAGGLNVGAQLHWMFDQDPDLKARTAQVLTYPQYWAFRLTGVAATERTSIGCHTDLWIPSRDTLSPLADRLGIRDKIAPVRMASDVLGPITAQVAARTGLPPTTPVTCGIHDSNASLLPHLITRKPPFSVVSTGTWIVVMTIGGTNPTLDPERDTLVNVNAFGDPVPSARFMGGREFDMILGGKHTAPTEEDVARVLEKGIMHLPTVAKTTGPFKGRVGAWVGEEPEYGSGLRSVAAAYYCALVTATCLGLTGHLGDIVVEGPFASNPDYRAMLAVATGSPVTWSRTATGTSQGAALLVRGATPPKPAEQERVSEFDRVRMARYAGSWQAACGQTAGQG